MIEFKIDNTILIIKVAGKWTYAISTSIQNEASSIVQEKNLTGILVDLREAEIAFSTAENYKGTASHLEKFPLGTKHAVVIAQEKKLKDEGRFFENVSINRGIRAKLFTDYEEAREWLLS